MKNMKRTTLSFILSGALILLSGHAFASTSTANLSVTVTVAATNCWVNGNQAVRMEFGTVQTSELSKATANVPVTIACDEAPQGTVSLAIKGTGSSFNTQALKTNVPGLGITLASPFAKVLDLNTYYEVSNTFGLSSKVGSFNLTAHLVSDGKTELTGGDFNASATLIMLVS
ncbi:fimbrial protein [Pseudescherichia vulneris]